MRFTRIIIPLAAMAVGLLALEPAPSQDQPQQQGVEVMARGPVHEAYAEPTAEKPEAPPVIKKQPPEPVAEEPPEQKPEGDNVEWISGYWAWDDDSNDYLWVSGFWREAPPGQAWVAGYWHQVEGGWQWSPGFWTTAENNEVTYVPPPPDPVETGPSTPAPQDDMVYSPGVWVWRETRFMWRPGFWVEFRPGWVWAPAHYVWTPGGYVFVDGYWDYPIADRGLLFAPVRFERLVAGFRFRPFYVVQPDFLLSALFVVPRRHHYFFGDYFEAGYRERGFVAWTDYRVARSVVDPNFAYYQARFRDESWTRNLEALYAARFRGEIARPPRTLIAQEKAITGLANVRDRSVTNTINISHIQNLSVLSPITKIGDTKITALASLAKNAPAERGAGERQTIKLAAVAGEERQRMVQRADEMRQVVRQREKIEANVGKPGTTPRETDRPRSAKLDLPRATRPVPARPGEGARPAESTANRRNPPPLPSATRRQEERPAPGADRGREPTRPPVNEPPAREPRPTTPPTTRPPVGEPRDREPTRPPATRPGGEPERNAPPVRRPEDPTRPPPIRDPRDTTRPDVTRDPRDTQRPAPGDHRDPTNPPPVNRGKPGVDPTDRPMPPTRERDDRRDVQPTRPMNNNPPGGARPGPMPPTGNKDRDRDERERQKDKEKKDKDK